MDFLTTNSSVIRSIKQRELLNEWLRLYARENRAPRMSDYRPERMADEMQDIMICRVQLSDSRPRFLIELDCIRMFPAFGVSGAGRDLETYFGPVNAEAIMPFYMQCASKQLPIYTIARINDCEDRVVDYERLLMPFSEGGQITHVMASLKAISEEGRFQIYKLMQQGKMPVPVLISMIGHDLAPQQPSHKGASEIEFQ